MHIHPVHVLSISGDLKNALEPLEVCDELVCFTFVALSFDICSVVWLLGETPAHCGAGSGGIGKLAVTSTSGWLFMSLSDAEVIDRKVSEVPVAMSSRCLSTFMSEVLSVTVNVTPSTVLVTPELSGNEEVGVAALWSSRLTTP